MALVTLPDGRQVNVPETGLIGSEQALQQGLQGALGSFGAGADVAGAELQPFAQGGTQAFNLQAAQSGALGPEAQQQAFADFTSSPEQQFIRERGLQDVLRSSAAIGGLGGGNVREELLRRGQGFAAQEFGSQFDRLGALSRVGFGAAGQRAGIAERTGQIGGQAIFGTGRDLSAGRTRAGEGIASAVSGTGSALADLISRQGTGTADILGQGTGNLANLLVGGGQAQAGSREQQAALLANISSGAGAQVSGLPGLPSLQRKTSVLPQLGSLAGGVGSVLDFFGNRQSPVGSSAGIAGGGTGLF